MTDWTLAPHPNFPAPPGPVLVIVLDGVGIGRQDDGDAVYLARTPTLDALTERATVHTTLKAHGTAVGMPSDGDMGNSEVGHNALGAGRVFDQGAKLVAQAIDTGAVFEGETWREATQQVQERGSTLHFIGLLSDGNVHSHIEHLFAMLRRAHADGVKQARVHILLDGRDVGPESALDYVEPLESVLTELSADGADFRIASGGGRMVTTMDRYNADWSIVERGWRAHILGESRGFASATEAIETLRSEDPDVIDQYLPDFTIVDGAGEAVGPIVDGDAVFFFNFRGDRAVEITRAFEEDDFSHFDRKRRPDVLYAGMMQYDGDLQLPRRFLVAPPTIDNTMGEYLSRNGITQLAVSETQKFGHVTYFWNGNRSGAFDTSLETYIEIPSDRVEFQERPWMKAAEITDAVIDHLERHPTAFVRVNYPNGDMVGHTGNLEAAIIAVEATDLSLARLLKAVAKLQGVAIVTADHGNADCMYQVNKKTGEYKYDEDGELIAHVSHTLNPVPFWIDDYSGHTDYTLNTHLATPGLSHIAATAFLLMGYQPPKGYDDPLIVAP